DAQIQVCIDERVSVVSFHWGHPPPEFVVALHQVGIKVWEQVGSVVAAKEAVHSGIDLIIAQGSEAGGHNYAYVRFGPGDSCSEQPSPDVRPPSGLVLVQGFCRAFLSIPYASWEPCGWRESFAPATLRFHRHRLTPQDNRETLSLWPLRHPISLTV